MKYVSAILKQAVLAATILTFFITFASTAWGQRIEHYNSPLYSPKNYDPSESVGNGLPPALKDIGIVQRLNEPLPLETQLKDEQGNPVKLGQFFGNRKPVILALVYYECPMLCNEVLNGLVGGLKGMNFNAGQEFDVVAISFDARENDQPGLAARKKENYLARYDRKGSENGWHFLTGDQAAIDAVTKAAGFNYRWDDKTGQFAHAAGIMVVTPEGKLARYFYGVDYAPKDLKFGLMEASQEKIGSPVDQLSLYCYHYDPATGKYGLVVLNVIRLGGVLTLLGMGIMFVVFWQRNKHRKYDGAEKLS
jgi:protein SCO1/2